jgi:hypothetical protein
MKTLTVVRKDKQVQIRCTGYNFVASADAACLWALARTCRLTAVALNNDSLWPIVLQAEKLVRRWNRASLSKERLALAHARLATQWLEIITYSDFPRI